MTRVLRSSRSCRSRHSLVPKLRKLGGGDGRAYSRSPDNMPCSIRTGGASPSPRFAIELLLLHKFDCWSVKSVKELTASFSLSATIYIHTIGGVPPIASNKHVVVHSSFLLLLVNKSHIWLLALTILSPLLHLGLARARGRRRSRARASGTAAPTQANARAAAAAARPTGGGSRQRRSRDSGADARREAA